MSISWQVLDKNVFLISADGNRPVLFAPLQGTVMEVNHSYVNRFSDAVRGSAEAATLLGLDPSLVERFLQTPPNAERRINPKWPETFEPTSVTIFLTHKCTLRCAYCYCHGGQGEDMPWAIFEKAVRFTSENARQRKSDFNVGFHGGDVGACWPLFQKCVAFIEQIGAEAGVRPNMSIGTNAFYSEEQADYVSRHIGSATVSIDGLPEVHDEYRVTSHGGPSLARILDSIKVFEKNRMSYSVRMTVTDRSLPKLSESVEFVCKNTSGGTIRAEPLYSRGRATSMSLNAPDPTQFVEAFRTAREIARKHNRILSYSGARVSGVYGSFCSYPAPTFGVTPQGNLTSCYEVLHPDDALRESLFYGHITPDGTTVVVDKDRVNSIRAWAKQRRDACAGCFCVFACAGDCAAKIMDRTLAEGETPKRCQITRSLVYDMLRAALAGENIFQEGPMNDRNLSNAKCNCVDCVKTTADHRDTDVDPHRKA